ncbi:MAG: hypothetical protein NWE89_07320 [Candidatus Bathyarchaeota archaeon]|nr:hypothetical protein [Candidatus Bathyarchaeota archaeon]
MTEKKYDRQYILNLSLELENLTREFYLALGQKFPEYTALFNKLANDEEIHARKYAKLLEKDVEEVSPQGSAICNIAIMDENGLINRMLQCTKSLSEIQSLEEALTLAAENERNVELLYYYSLGLVDDLDKDIVTNIMFAEHAHRLKLEDLAQKAKDREL